MLVRKLQIVEWFSQHIYPFNDLTDDMADREQEKKTQDQNVGVTLFKDTHMEISQREWFAWGLLLARLGVESGVEVMLMPRLIYVRLTELHSRVIPNVDIPASFFISTSDSNESRVLI